MKIENFQSQVCVCAASTNLTCAKGRAEMGLKMAKIQIKDLVKSYDGEYKAVNKVNLEIGDNDFCVLLGPSGCGKTTLLRMIAGLETITDGDIYIDGVHMNNVLPKDRDIAMVFQSYALYPHMTVYKNMAFGLKMKKVSLDEIDKRIQDAAKYLDLDEYKDRKPRNLSGGQQQRVALGRALVKKPKVFLMDEPLSNLDAKLRNQTRETIVRIHENAGATTIYVTHDQVEAMSMGTKIVVMNKGVVQQIGSPEQIFESPDNMFVEGFIGSPSINFIEGTYTKGTVTFGDMIFSVSGEQEKTLGAYEGKNIIMGIRPEFFEDLADIRQKEEDLNLISMKINFVERLGSESIINGCVSGQKVTAKIKHTRRYATDEQIEIGVKAKKVLFFDKETRQAIK